jgi:hypothetical protein
VLFAVLGQMHERYLVWGAALTAAGVGVGLGMTLMHLVVSGLALGMMAHSQLGFDRGFAPEWHRFIAGMHPDAGWAVLLCAGIYLYMALRPGGWVGVERRGAEGKRRGGDGETVRA